MKYFTIGYQHMDVDFTVPLPEEFEVKNGVGVDDTILQDIFAPDPVTGNPSSDVFVEGNAVNDNLREYITNVLRRPLSESSRVSDADEALNFARGIDETKADYLQRIVELTQEGL